MCQIVDSWIYLGSVVRILCFEFHRYYQIDRKAGLCSPDCFLTDWFRRGYGRSIFAPHGIGEWIMNPRMAGIPVDEYMPTAKDFNPQEFSGKKIAQLAKDAGMKYIIITSKHHEGFAMFHSKVHPFNIVDATPFGRDPMKELSAACRELGLGFGFYYSHNQDWTSPGASGGPKKHDDGTPATFDDYFYKKCLPQVKEICTNYGQIDFVWFDTPGE